MNFIFVNEQQFEYSQYFDMISSFVQEIHFSRKILFLNSLLIESLFDETSSYTISPKFNLMIKKNFLLFFFFTGFPKESAYDTTATLFSLSHPLDDICPVAIHQSGIVNIFNNNNYRIVFTSDWPSICMIYDVTSKQHSVFWVRNIRADEGGFGDKMMSGLYSINHSNKVS